MKIVGKKTHRSVSALVSRRVSIHLSLSPHWGMSHSGPERTHLLLPGSHPHFPNFHLLSPHYSLKSYTKQQLTIAVFLKANFKQVFPPQESNPPLTILSATWDGSLWRISFIIPITPTGTARIASVTAQNCLISLTPSVQLPQAHNLENSLERTSLG